MAWLYLFITGLLTILNVHAEITLTHKRTLKEGVYDLFWGYDSENITFEVQVNTTGYVGLGISPNGGMANSDIVIGWVKDGIPYLKDRFATGNSAPIIDDIQDVSLLSGSENGTHTTLRFTRKRKLCNDQDRAIDVGTIRLIWSYSDTEPASEEESPSYHGSTQRGSISIHLLTPEASQKIPPLPNDTFTIDFLNRNVTLPTLDTTYYCTGFKMPKYNKKHHMIKFEPVIQAGHETIVHHILIYACWNNVDADAHHLKEWVCYTDNMPPELGDCTAPILGWAIGGLEYNYPKEVGLPIGTDQDPDFVIMETHYDNPGKRSDIVDASGIRFHVTPSTRQYDAGVLQVGYNVGPRQLVPPHFHRLLSRGHCSKECLSEGMASQSSGINIIAAMLHTHLLGIAVHVRHLRNGTEQPLIAWDDNYDFNYQDIFRLEEPAHVLPSDDLLVDCFYKSTDKAKMTYGGLATSNEMCLSYLIYYPRINLTRCESTLTQEDFKPLVGDEYLPSIWYWQVPAVDFTREDKRKIFQELEETSSKQAVCSHGHIKYSIHRERINPVKITSEYNPSNTSCPTPAPPTSPVSTDNPSSGSRITSMSFLGLIIIIIFVAYQVV